MLEKVKQMTSSLTIGELDPDPGEDDEMEEEETYVEGE